MELLLSDRGCVGDQPQKVPTFTRPREFTYGIVGKTTLLRLVFDTAVVRQTLPLTANC
jgi:hypothetical protein